MPKTIPTDKARQGRRGRNVLIILVVALILAFIVWAGVEIYGEKIEPPQGGTSTMLESPSALSSLEVARVAHSAQDGTSTLSTFL